MLGMFSKYLVSSTKNLIVNKICSNNHLYDINPFVPFSPRPTFVFPLSSETTSLSIIKFGVDREYVILTGRKKVEMAAVILIRDTILLAFSSPIRVIIKCLPDHVLARI